MKTTSKNLKITIGAIYLTILFVGLYFLFSNIDIRDLTSYEFIRANKNILLDFKNKNFFVLSVSFFIFSIIWLLLLGFGGPLLLFAGFVFGKWWGLLLSSISLTVGATLLYLLAGLFFKEMVDEYLSPRFSRLKKFFKTNELFYLIIYRFIGGGIPYGIQNVLPVLFNVKVKNYMMATCIGGFPAMFVTVSLASGIEQVIDKNETLSLTKMISSPEIYLPILGFFIILFLAFILKKLFFKNEHTKH